MMFDGEPKIVNGHKFWKPEKYKGYLIQPYESPDGKRTFLIGGSKQWIYDTQKLEDAGAYIDMLDIAKKVKKGKKDANNQDK